MKYDSSVSRIQENGRTISIFSLSVPVFFESISSLLLGTVHALMLSGYSQEGVTATSVANQLENIAIVIVSIIIWGTSIITSIELGSENRTKAAIIAGTAAVSTAISSLTLGTLIFIFSPTLSAFMNLKGTTASICSVYLGIKSLFLPLVMIKSLLVNLLICNGYSKWSFISTITTNALNVIYGYVVLYSGIKLPVDGITALAYSPLFIHVLPLIICIIVLRKKNCPFKMEFDFKSLKRILKLGTPSGLGMLSFTATQTLATGFMASLGNTVVNAKVYVSNIVGYTSKIGFCLAKGHSVLVGRYRGRNEYEKMQQLFSQNLFIAVMSNTLLSIIVFIFCKPLISMFSTDGEILKIAVSVMAVDIIVEIARAVNNVTEQSLNANGDVKTTFAVPLFTCWIFGVLLAYILGIKCGLGLMGCWIGFAADETAKATLYLLRWKSGKWKNTYI